MKGYVIGLFKNTEPTKKVRCIVWLDTIYPTARKADRACIKMNAALGYTCDVNGWMTVPRNHRYFMYNSIRDIAAMKKRQKK